jgi:pimeloyl-ACP methyl ester carboxylesterase
MAALHRGGALTEDDWANELAPALFGAAYRRKYPDRIRFVARWRVKYPTDPVGLARQWEAWRSFDVCDRLHQIAAPTLILHGTDDGISPAENAENLADAIPGARIQWLPEVGHSPNAEAPELFNGALRSFFAPLG